MNEIETFEIETAIKDRLDLAGSKLVEINGETVGPWTIEASQTAEDFGIPVLDVTVWIGGQMVGLQFGTGTVKVRS